MKSRLRTLFGVDKKRKAALPNSSRQLAVGGILCLLIWPGIGLVLLATDALRPGERIYAILSPWLLVTLLGIYLIGQSFFARDRKPRKRTYNRNQKESR